MGRSASTGPDPRVGALWLGWGAVSALCLALLTGGATASSDALALAGVIALIAMGGWFSSSIPPLRRFGWPFLVYGALIIVVVATTLPICETMARQGLYAPVQGKTLSIAPLATKVEVAKLLGLGCAFLCGAFSARGAMRTAAGPITAVIFTGAVWAGWGLILFAMGASGARLGAPFLSPNTAATLLGVVLVLTVGRLLAWRDSHRGLVRRRWAWMWLGSALVLLAAALFLTQSRAGVVTTLLCIGGLLASWPRRSTKDVQRAPQRRMSLILGAFVIGSVVVLEGGRELALRFSGLSEAAADRREIFGLYWRAFLDAPLIGGGLGSATYVTKLGLTPQNYDALWNVQSAHNWLLQWLAEGGLVATALMITAVGGLIVMTYRRLTAANARRLLPLLFVDLLVVAHGLTDFGLQIPALAMLWSFLLGLQVAVSAETTEGRSVRTDRSGEKHA